MDSTGTPSPRTPMRYMITDDLWAAMGAAGLAGEATQGRPSRRRCRTGCSSRPSCTWRAPGRAASRPAGGFRGAGTPCTTGSVAGSPPAPWPGLFEAMTADPQFGEGPAGCWSTRRTVPRPSACGRGAAKKKVGSAPGDRRGAAGGSARQPAAGLTSKIVVTAADESTAIAVDVRPGQAHDAPAAEGHAQADRPPGRARWPRSSGTRGVRRRAAAPRLRGGRGRGG